MAARNQRSGVAVRQAPITIRMAPTASRPLPPWRLPRGDDQFADFWPLNRLNTIKATAPTLIAESATLNTGKG